MLHLDPVQLQFYHPSTVLQTIAETEDEDQESFCVLLSGYHPHRHEYHRRYLWVLHLDPAQQLHNIILEKVILDFGKGKSKSEDYWIIGKTYKPILSQYIA